jgi:hypothetical protein
MSGRRHHYLPRFLQRPFAFRQKGKQFYVHAHHRAHGSFPANVMDVGQEWDFYGNPERSALDDQITAGERKLAITLHRLNRQEDVPQLDVAQVIGALSIRTKAMRAALTSLVPLIVDGGRERLLSTKRLRQEFRDEFLDSKKQRDFVDEKMKEHPRLSRDERARARAQMLLRWKAFVASREEEFIATFRAIASEMFDRIEREALSLADNAFLGALEQDPGMHARAEKFVEEMRFGVWCCDNDFFVLGDCGPIALYSDEGWRLALGAISSDVQMEFVFLPISPSHCIVGQRGHRGHGLSPVDVNRKSAALSYEFIVSHLGKCEPLDDLSATIGSMVPIESQDSIFEFLEQ